MNYLNSEYLLYPEIIIYGLVLIAVLSTLGIFINRLILKRGFGIRVIQVFIISVILPILTIMVIFEILPISLLAVIIGTMIGYAFNKKEDSKGK